MPEFIRMPPIVLEKGKLTLTITSGVSKAPTQSLRRRVHNLVHREPRIMQGAAGTAYFDARFDGLATMGWPRRMSAFDPLRTLADRYSNEWLVLQRVNTRADRSVLAPKQR